MSAIKRLSDSISQLETLLRREQESARANPHNFAASLTLNSLQSQLDELRNELRRENTNRSKEVISLRFMGEDAQYGSIPLLIVGGLTDAFSQAIFETSKFIQFGKRGGKKVNKVVRDKLDLRLESIGSGSTVLYISAKTSPDLFGGSSTQRTFDNFLDFISSENPDVLLEKISEVGTKSIRHLSSFFKKLNDDNLELEIYVDSPFRENKTWAADKARIISMYTALSELKIDDPEEEDFAGEIIALSKRGKIEILGENGFRYVADYPDSLLDIIKELHLGQMCAGRLLRTTIKSPIAGKTKNEWDLVQIAPTD